jgi:hypothetical protein
MTQEQLIALHDARVAELLEANNEMLEQLRAAKKEVTDLTITVAILARFAAKVVQGNCECLRLGKLRYSNLTDQDKV